MSSIASLERLLSNETALEQAQRSATYAQNTRQILNQPLSNFNTGSLRDPAGLPSLERLQGSIRVQQYMESGTIRHSPAYNPPNTATTSTATGARGAGGSVASATATVNAAQSTTTTASTAARIRLPTTAQIASQARTIAPAVGRSVASGVGQGGLTVAGQLFQGLNDDLNEDLRNQLPNNVQPVWDRLAGPNGALEQWLTPPNLAGAREGLRQLNDLDRLQNGLPPRSQAGQIAQQLTCAIFGVGCPTTEPEGVPNLGSPGVAPPFYGGQSPGVKYDVDLHFEYDDLVHGLLVDRPNQGGTFYGPIGYPEIGSYIDSFNRDTWYIGFSRGFENSTAIGFYTAWVSVKTNASKPRLISFSVSRIDGQPDTGGNPALLPDAVNRPATAPALANRTIPPPANAPTLPSTGVPNPATTPIATTPTAPPDTGVEDPLAPLRDIDPLAGLLPFLGAIPFMIPTSGKGFNPSGAQQPGQAPTLPPTATGDIPTPTCRYDSSNIAGRVDQTNVTLNAVQLFMQNEMMGKLNTIDAKLGPQIPGGGIGNFIKKTWNFLQVDRVLSILTWIGVLHNAYMLSNALTQTLFSAFSNILDVFGVEDADGEALDVGAIVSGWTDAFFKRIFGVETVDGIKAGWKAFNRIYQAAANIISSIQSITFSMVEMLETISNYVGRIGNALRKSGEVLENSFNWMNPNANYTNNRFFNALNNTSEAIEAIDQVASETLSIQETGAELFNQKQEFDKAKSDAENLVKEQETTGKDESTRPNVTITPSDEIKAGS